MATRYGWMADTDEKAFEALIGILRKMSPGQKLVHVFQMASMLHQLAEGQVRRLYPETEGSMTPDLLRAFTRLLEALDRLEIDCMVGGSVASSIHGAWRATGGVEIVARLGQEHVEPLAEELQRDFYVDAGQIRSALEHGRPFNVIHFQTSFKFDLFPLGSGRYEQVQFARRRFEQTALFGAGTVEFAVASPEDVILNKLRWYRRGGEVSDAQWNDVLGVIAVQAERLDLAYLREWAQFLKIADLVEEALAERHGPHLIPVTDVFDLHTIAPRDVKAAVEAYLDEAHRLGLRALRIIHGRGVGVQREIVRGVLARTPFVVDYADAPAEAGGWGATVVTLE